MRHAYRIAGSLLAVTVLAGAVFAADGVDVGTNVRINWDLLQIVNSSGTRQLEPTDETWLDLYFLMSMGTSFTAHATLQNKLRILVEYVGAIWYTMPGEWDEDNLPGRTGYATMRQAYGRYFFGDIDHPATTRLTIGYFPFDYAYESKAFGEYLFKSGTYPGFVLSAGDIKGLTGLCLKTRLPAQLEHTILFTVEMDCPPMYDLSPSYVLSYPGETVQLYAGVMLDRLIWNRTRKTRPRSSWESNFFKRAYIDSDGDTTWYTKAGVKVMARGVVDFKRLFSSKRLGENDLKLYAEGAILGVKNYPGYYDNLLERIPVMVGINLPVFKLLDLLAVEVEYYGSPWRNNPDYSTYYPIPYTSFEYDENDQLREIRVPEEGAGEKGKSDNFKWAIVAQKTVRRLTLDAKIASDHFRATDGAGRPEPNERMHRPTDWYWKFGITAGL